MTESALPKDAKARKGIPLFSGLIDYFPSALIAVATLSRIGNDQHNPGKPLHWDRSKSGDELDAMMRHVFDGDWEAVAWRALANLQKQIEEGYVPQGWPKTLTEFEKALEPIKCQIEFSPDMQQTRFVALFNGVQEPSSLAARFKINDL